MRCQACDYELWHCTGRTCPECGANFSITDFDFQDEEVLFHCPHCDQGVEGEPPHGLPPAHVQQCESCGLAVGLDLYVIRPSGDYKAESFGALLPIRQTDENWITRYFKTVWLVLTKPQNAISRVPVQEPLWNAWKFFLTTLFILMTVGLIPAVLILLFANVGRTGTSFDISVLGFVFLLQIVFVFFFTCVYAVMWSLVAHLILQITGGSTFTLRRTLQAILYGGSACIVGIVPCIGGIASFVWWVVATTNMIVRGQRVHGSRASVATLAGPIFFVTCVCGSYLILIFSILEPALTRARSTAQTIQQQQQIQVDTNQVNSEDGTTDQQSE